MNHEIRDKWIAALRSGEYKQGTGSLQCLDKYCCLGVLADLAVKEGICRKNVHQNTTIVFFNEDSVFLPNSVQNWSGVETNQQFALSGMNDIQKYSFSQIADWIEENL